MFPTLNYTNSFWKFTQYLFPKSAILWHEPLCLTNEWRVWHGKITELYFPSLGPGYTLNWKRRTMSGNGFTVFLPKEISSKHLKLICLQQAMLPPHSEYEIKSKYKKQITHVAMSLRHCNFHGEGGRSRSNEEWSSVTIRPMSYGL